MKPIGQFLRSFGFFSQVSSKKETLDYDLLCFIDEQNANLGNCFGTAEMVVALLVARYYIKMDL